MRRFMQLLVCLIAVLPASGQTPIETNVAYERLFFPVGLVFLQGAGGTMWGTEIVIRNESGDPVNIFQNDCSYHCQCRVLVMCQGPRPTPPRSPFTNLVSVDDLPNTGTFLYVERGRAEDVAINTRLVNFARADENLGTELPVVREADFRGRTIWLTNVPFDATARQHLRVFAVPRPEAELVNVRVWDVRGDVLLGETTLMLAEAKLDGLLRPYEYPTRPDFAQLTDLRAQFQINPGVKRVRIELRPVAAGTRLWAFVSATDNTTQHVTLVTPQ